MPVKPNHRGSLNSQEHGLEHRAVKAIQMFSIITKSDVAMICLYCMRFVHLGQPKRHPKNDFLSSMYRTHGSQAQ